MKGSHIVFIIIIVIVLTGIFTWIWLQNFIENNMEESFGYDSYISTQVLEESEDL